MVYSFLYVFVFSFAAVLIQHLYASVSRIFSLLQELIFKDVDLKYIIIYLLYTSAIGFPYFLRNIAIRKNEVFKTN